MTAPIPPRPDKPVPLSARELRALAAIECEFHAAGEPRGERAGAQRWIHLRLWVPAGPAWLSLLLVAALLGVLAGSLYSPVGTTILVVFVVGLGMPALFSWFIDDR